MNISKEKFIELAKEHLIALESYKIDKNGNKHIEIFGIEKLYEAINFIQCRKSEQLTIITLEEAIAKAKHNMDKIKDVDKHIEDIR